MQFTVLCVMLNALFTIWCLEMDRTISPLEFKEEHKGK